MNSIKIELGAILSLKNVILRHALMHDYINNNDKDPSWDGFIYLYKSDDLKVENIVYRVPVQVKGKNESKWLYRKAISYPVEYKHLRNYYCDGGVFYFVIVISDNGEKTSIFYNSLTTIKLKHLLKGAEKKRPDQTKNIVLQKLEKNDSNQLYKLLAQFGMEHVKQGSGNSEIIRKAINIDVMDKVDSIQAISYSAKNEADIFNEIMTGEISLYGHRSDLDMWFPFDYSHQMGMVFKRIVKMEKPLGVDGVNFYDSYLVEGRTPKDDKPTIRVSENLTIDLLGGKVHFDAVGKMDTLINDAKFINAIKESKAFYVNNIKISEITNVNIPTDMRDKVHMILDLGYAFEEIGFICHKKFSDFTEENWKQINQLLNAFKGKIKPKEGCEHVWYIWHWDEKAVPLLLARAEDGKIEIINWITTKKYGLFSGDEKRHVLPRIVLYKRDVLEKLYDFDDKSWIEEIRSIEYCEDIAPEIFQSFIELLCAYDTTCNEDYYLAAKMMMDKVLEVYPEDENGIINKMQLIKRKEELLEEHITKLEEIGEKTDNLVVKCAVNILLENKRVAQKIVLELTEEQQRELMSYPIYNLL